KPAVPRDGGVVRHVVADHPLKLRVGMVGHNALIKAVAVVIGVQLWLRCPIMLNVAACNFTAIANGWPMVPVKAFRHSEIRREIVINTELDVTRVQNPRLITCWITSNVKAHPIAGASPVRRNNTRGYLCSGCTD